MVIKNVVTQSYGERIKESIKGFIFGILLFIASFFVLYTNEGSIDLSKIAETSIEIKDSGNYEGQFVSKSGKIFGKDKIGDNKFIKAGDYLFIDRNVEMYSWREREHTETEENYGGSKTTTTTYYYEKVWTTSPENSNNFHDFKENNNLNQNKINRFYKHRNPPKKFDSTYKMVTNGYIDDYNFQTNGLRFPKGTPLIIDDKILIDSSISHTSNYIFVGSGSLNQPIIGDIRISYKVLNNGTLGTIFGKVQGKNIVKYIHDKESSIFHLFDKDRQGSIEELHNEYLTSLWLTRLFGFLMMWVGLSLILNIFSTLLTFIPFLSQAGRFIIGVISFVIALVLSLITILIGIIAHNIYILILVLILLGVGIYYYIKKNKFNINIFLKKQEKELKNNNEENKKEDEIEFDIK